MTIAHLLDHRCNVWRSSVTYGEMREEVRAWAIVATVDCGVRRPSARIGDAGPGHAAIGERVIYMVPEIDVRERDVVELISGPDSGKFEIDGPPTRPRGHHLELRARHFTGEL